MVSQNYTCTTLVFYDPRYPQFCAEETLHRLIPGPFCLVDAAHLVERLRGEARLLVSFHGPYFPKACWPALLHFLEAGGNLAIFGGMPFARPVNEEGEIEPEQDAYTRQLYLGPFFQVPVEGSELALVADQNALLLRDCPLSITGDAPGTFWACYPKLTQTEDHPEDLGSAGAFDTILRPLLYALAQTPAGEQRVATPVFLLEQRSGRFKGGRWLISAWQPQTDADWLANAEAIERLILLAVEGPILFDVRPALGCYQPGEIPSLIVATRTGQEVQFSLTVSQSDEGKVLHTFAGNFSPLPVQQEQHISLPVLWQPGLYQVEIEYSVVGGQPLRQQTGFWVWDRALVETTRSQRLTAGRDYFYRDRQLFLVYGTTYMDSQVQRKFLHLPNPARWERDLREMKSAGINLIRTGIWTAWRENFPMAGLANEAFLRALDAFVMTVCKHQIQLIFTCFAFFPPLFEGENPWLDPRSLEAQEDLVALLARRYAGIELLSWDLINEPSFGDPKKIFASRPLPHYDRFEIDAFQRWLAERYTLSELQLRWRQTPAELPAWERIIPPQESDFDSDVRNTQVRASLKVADYTRFSQDMFLAWAARMRAAIRAAGGTTLVGVGQDEAGARLAPQFYAPAVDYTTTHPWWNIDDLLWDMLLDKTLDKPNLIQETGVMLARDIDGRPWRSEQASAHLLERKLVTGLIARGAGLVQWLWHTNGYMTSDNENSIGLVRADGSAKPEMRIMWEFGRLVRALNGRLVEAASPPETWLLIPYAQWFARPAPARDGTRQAVRVLGYDLGIIPQMVGEHGLTQLTSSLHPPRVMIVPAAQLLDQSAWRLLQQYVYQGGTLLVNGVLGRDAHNLPFEPGIVGLPDYDSPQPVARYETLTDLQGNPIQVTFAEEMMSYIKKAHNHIVRVEHGAGFLFWCGLPLELVRETSALRALYHQVLFQRPCEPSHASSPVLISRQPLRDGTLILGVSESGCTQELTLTEGIRVIIKPNRAGALILGTDSTARAFGGLHVAE